MKPSFASRFLTALLYLIFAAGVVCAATLPWMLDTYADWLYDSYLLAPGYRAFITAFLYAVAAPGLWIIGEMIAMMRSIPGDPFVRRNARALQRVGILLFLTSALFALKCFLYVTLLTLGGALLLFVAGLFALTLASLFRQAVAFKEENELTI